MVDPPDIASWEISQIYAQRSHLHDLRMLLDGVGPRFRAVLYAICRENRGLEMQVRYRNMVCTNAGHDLWDDGSPMPQTSVMFCVSVDTL